MRSMGLSQSSSDLYEVGANQWAIHNAWKMRYVCWLVKPPIRQRATASSVSASRLSSLATETKQNRAAWGRGKIFTFSAAWESENISDKMTDSPINAPLLELEKMIGLNGRIHFYSINYLQITMFDWWSSSVSSLIINHSASTII